ncbi:endo-1,4-beta-xylanase [Teredinibacter purpureus]|uniref:endo-1,4-beta-xylanase n=1 Tax=Teredinibacter purpureus TaxID=2731756 RepID=UPI0005F7A785|nr:endo-1,4-beta-xylanase [Teredinibacter purpureus]
MNGILTSLLLCLALILSACSGSGTSSGSTPTAAPSPTDPPTATPIPTATPAPTPTPAPTDILGSGQSAIDNASVAFWGGDNNGENVGQYAVVEVEDSRFSQALRITVDAPDGEFWNGQLQFPTTTVIEQGDTVLVHVYMRSIANTYETGNAFTTVFLEDNTSYNKYLTREITAAAEWVEYYLPAEILDDQAIGNLALKFGFGAGDRAQTFEIAGVELLHFDDVDISLLPITRPSYEGRATDASWRIAAADRIEQIRKGDFQLQVLDDNGTYAANAAIAVNFTQHAYHFGSVTVGNLLMGQGTDNDIYRSKVLELFNQSGPENDLKWAPWAGEWGDYFSQETTLAGLQWLRDNGLATRGHVMVWPSKRNLPELIQQYLPEGDPENADPEALNVVLDHIDDIASATINHIDEWDVVNEPYDNHYLMDAFGNSVMVEWFNRARQNLPTQGLYLNDYSILSAGGRNFAHQQHFEDTLQFLVDNNAPITGMGMQSHFSDSPTSIEQVYALLERFNTAFPHLNIRSTEFDINSDDEELQADYTRDFLTIFFSHPATVGVQLWGFWANAHWSPKAALYDTDWREKPNAIAWKNQIYSEWWNNFNGTTDIAGQFSERGFYGQYEATVIIGDQQKVFTFELLPGGNHEFVLSFETND